MSRLDYLLAALVVTVIIMNIEAGEYIQAIAYGAIVLTLVGVVWRLGYHSNLFVKKAREAEIDIKKRRLALYRDRLDYGKSLDEGLAFIISQIDVTDPMAKKFKDQKKYLLEVMEEHKTDLLVLTKEIEIDQINTEKS